MNACLKCISECIDCMPTDFFQDMFTRMDTMKHAIEALETSMGSLKRRVTELEVLIQSVEKEQETMRKLFSELPLGSSNPLFR